MTIARRRRRAWRPTRRRRQRRLIGQLAYSLLSRASQTNDSRLVRQCVRGGNRHAENRERVTGNPEKLAGSPRKISDIPAARRDVGGSRRDSVLQPADE